MSATSPLVSQIWWYHVASECVSPLPQRACSKSHYHSVRITSRAS